MKFLKVEKTSAGSRWATGLRRTINDAFTAPVLARIIKISGRTVERLVSPKMA
jgi:hypothetical protein